MRRGRPLASRVASAAGQNPAPAAVGMADAMLVLELRARARQVLVDLAAQARDIVGVDEVEPGVGAVRGERVAVAEQRLPPVREVHAPCDEVPVPDPVVGGLDGDRVALLATAQIHHHLVVADRVADRPLQARRVDRALDEVVGDTELGGLEVDLVVVLSGEDDDGRRRLGVPRVAHEVQPGAVSEAVVDEVKVVAAPRESPAARAGSSAPTPAETSRRPAPGACSRVRTKSSSSSSTSRIRSDSLRRIGAFLRAARRSRTSNAPASS